MDQKHINIVRRAQINSRVEAQNETKREEEKKSIFIAIYYSVVDDGRQRAHRTMEYNFYCCVHVY